MVWCCKCNCLQTASKLMTWGFIDDLRLHWWPDASLMTWGWIVNPATLAKSLSIYYSTESFDSPVFYDREALNPVNLINIETESSVLSRQCLDWRDVWKRWLIEQVFGMVVSVCATVWVVGFYDTVFIARLHFTGMPQRFFIAMILRSANMKEAEVVTSFIHW